MGNAMRSPSLPFAWTAGAIVLAAVIATGLLYLLNWTVAFWPCVAAWLVAVTPVTFALYWLDKRRAERAGPRVPETTLHTLAATGGSLGAYLGMRAFRHKTIKGRFRVVFWLIVATQVVLLAWAVKDAWGAANGRGN
jgi:uncharacterized membrane protein YsdA (DUF1294 family)